MDPRFFRKYADLITEAERSIDEAANPQAQKGAQAILQALSPEEEQQLADTVKQAGNDPARVMQALGITQQDLQQPQVAEGIAPDLKGKIIQALWTAGLVGSVAAGVAGHEILSANLTLPILLAAQTVWGSAAGQIGRDPAKIQQQQQAKAAQKAQALQKSRDAEVQQLIRLGKSPEDAQKTIQQKYSVLDRGTTSS